jgi:hypothetical protein
MAVITVKVQSRSGKPVTDVQLDSTVRCLLPHHHANCASSSAQRS